MSGVSTAPLAVVTGASSGIGAEFARALAARGHRVLAVARRADRLAALAAEHDGLVIPEVRDLTAEGAAQAVAERAEELGGADLLVANAGAARRGRFADAKPSDSLATIDLNVVATVGLVGEVLPRMVERGGGGVLVVSSSLGFVPSPHLAVYGATKAFLLSFTEALSAELAGTGVRTMALCPGPTTSEFAEVAGLGDLVESTPGHLTPGQVVTDALRAWDSGRTVRIPGVIQRGLTLALAAAPRPVARSVMGRIFG